MEIWKDIKGFEGKYQISSYGNVKSFTRKEPFIMKFTTCYGKDGIRYHQVSLYCDGKYNKILVSRLVAQAFIENPENKPEVDHIDRNTLNNNVNNLRWVTRTENMNNEKTYQIRQELYKGNSFAKKYNHEEILSLYRQGMRMVDISRKLNIPYGSVSYIIHDKRS